MIIKENSLRWVGGCACNQTAARRALLFIARCARSAQVAGRWCAAGRPATVHTSRGTAAQMQWPTPHQTNQTT